MTVSDMLDFLRDYLSDYDAMEFCIWDGEDHNYEDEDAVFESEFADEGVNTFEVDSKRWIITINI